MASSRLRDARNASTWDAMTESSGVAIRRTRDPRCATLLALALAAPLGGACVPPAARVSSVGTTAATPAAASAPPAATPSVTPAAPVLAPVRSVADETRATLDQLVTVDTSHGHESDLLGPIADRLRQAGLPVEIVESAPGRGNLVARYKGTGAKKPLLLIAHVDVVPVEGQPWTVPAFRVTEKDGFLWGRGVNDDKGMVAAVVAIALEMARTKPVLSRDVIFALTAGEETGGTAGARWLVENRKDLVSAEIALNEGGGARVSDDFARVVLVGIGVAEKTFQSYRLTVRGKGGHSSIPPTDSDPVVTLARALIKVGEHRFPAHVLPPVRETFAASAKDEAPPRAEALARVGATGQLSKADDRMLSRDRAYNAQLRTTCVTTQLEGSPQDNVLPTTVQAVVNCRILPDETREQTLETLRSAIGDPTVEIAPIADFGYGPYSPVDGVVPAAVRKVAAAMWPGVPVVSSMGAGATDSRHLRSIGVLAYGVSPVLTSRAESLAGRTAHGPDERSPAAWVPEGARFLREVTYELAR
jgi:acetylornithine deacetylase/succinyl-diaminopimelate desuccinylase-like protein